MRPELKSARLATGPSLPYAEQGDRSGIPVVFLHAFVDSWRSFEAVLSQLPRPIHAFAPTQRGHADADCPPSGYTLAELGADVGAFLDAVGLEAAVIVGSSSGGYVAQRFAVDHPERTLGLVLIGTPRSLRDKPAAVEFARSVAGLRDPIDPEFVRRFVESTISGSVPAAFLEAMIGESLKVPASVWQAAVQGLLEATPPTETGTITAPTLILWGDRDQFLPRVDQEALAAAIPGSQLIVYEGAGHVVLWEQPERVAGDVVAFVVGATG
jgi:pimeloyl-ACP methyl ester carboxylesterase